MFATSVVALGLFAVVASVGAFTDTSAPAPQINKGGPIHQGIEYEVFPPFNGQKVEGQYKLGGLSVGSGNSLLPLQFFGAENSSGIPSLVVSAGSLRTGNGNPGDTYLNGNVTIGSAERVVVPQGGGLGQIIPEYNANLTVVGMKGMNDPDNYNTIFSDLRHCSNTPQPVCVNDMGELFLCDAGVDVSCLGQGNQGGGE